MSAEFIALPSFIVIAVACLFLYDEVWGLTALLSGFVLFDRNFAYLHYPIGSLPLYVTEIALAAWILSRLIHNPRVFVQRLHALPRTFWIALGIFWMIGVISFLRGNNEFRLIHVLRDSALCYYSLFMLLVASGDYTIERLKKIVVVICPLLLARSLIILNIHTGHLVSTPPVMNGQPAAFSMIFSVALLCVLSMNAFRLSFLWTSFAALLTSAILIATVRSAWTGLVAGLLLLVYLHQLIRARGLQARQILFSISGLFLLTLCMLTFLPRLPHLFTLKTALPSTEKPAKASKVSPAAVTIPTAIPTANRQAHSTPATTPQELPTKNEPLPIDRVREEVASFSKGLASNNVMTRVWMWRDAVWEILSIELFSPGLQENDLKRYHLPYPPAKAPPGVLIIRIDGARLSGETVVFHYSKSGKPTDINENVWLKRIRQFLLGIPFGKPYLPPEVIWHVNSPNRYDPHNSLLHVFYRMGFLGFAAFCGIVFIVLKSGAALLREPVPDLYRFRLGAALLAVLGYFLTHAMTDNVLENPFKSIWFWIPCGLILSLRRARS